ncbi:MAG: DUF4397 domain-containing protein [Chitinophagales bacterium]|nr:DUF4397 domain-containing protein [Chitinophagales bacterium]MDW8419312.1 DUF4397 domain-containing protein [Chitinophagales bacterium]
MKKFIPKFSLLALALLTSYYSFAGGASANVQVIHNCAAPAASTVDVYVNGTLFLNDFDFREATPYTQVPAGLVFNVGVAPGNSTSVNDTIASFLLGPLDADSNYVVIASGTVGTGFNPAIPFDLKVIPNSKTSAPAGFVNFIVHHGSTDAPVVDVRVRNGGPLLANNLSYGNSGTVFGPNKYFTAPASWYQLEVITFDSSSVINTWIANLSGASGKSAVVFASGFVNPSNNNNGPAFGLWAAFNDGSVVELPVRKTANVQLVHNAADPSLSVVDVYVNGVLGFPDLKFRGATPFIQITANFPIRVGLAPGNSTSWSDTLKTWLFFFQPDTNYVAMAVGNYGSGFTPNPDGISTSLDIVLKQGAVISNGNPAAVSFCVAHGATDAPTVDVRVRSGGPLLVNNAPYKAISNYLTVPANYYALEVIAADSSSVIDSWIANLSTLGGSGAFVFASGYLDSAANNNGRLFNLFAALPTGQVVEFPRRKTANVQFIHNCYDPIADTVDVYANGNKFFDNFAYRSASPILGVVTADFPINIGFAPGNSTSVNDTFWQKTFFFSPGETYIGIAQGLVGTGFAANPDGKDTKFNLFVKTPGKSASDNPSQFQFFVDHGCTDCPTVDVVVRNGPTLVNDAAYGDLTNYLGVPGDNYILDIKSSNGATTLASYVFDVTSRNGQAGVVIASGFLNPAANGNSPYPVGLYLVTAGGGPFQPLPLYTSVIDLTEELGMKMFPNPTSGQLNFNFSLDQTTDLDITITDLNGRLLQEVFRGNLNAGNHQLSADVSNYNNGLYFVRVVKGESIANVKFSLVK